MEPLTLKSLKSFIDDQINYTLEAGTDSNNVEDKAYYKGRLKALNVVMEEIDKWYKPTPEELETYTVGFLFGEL